MKTNKPSAFIRKHLKNGVVRENCHHSTLLVLRSIFFPIYFPNGSEDRKGKDKGKVKVFL